MWMASLCLWELARNAHNSLIARICQGPFTISADGSNDSHSKQFPIVIRSINADSGCVTSELLSVTATGENLKRLEYEISFNNVQIE